MSKLDNMQINQIVDTLPSNGEWFSSSNREVFKNAATRLRKLGLSFAEIQEFLSELYSAAADEYGG